jgi:hypothetical protein
VAVRESVCRARRRSAFVFMLRRCEGRSAALADVRRSCLCWRCESRSAAALSPRALAVLSVECASVGRRSSSARAPDRPGSASPPPALPTWPDTLPSVDRAPRLAVGLIAGSLSLSRRGGHDR